MAEKEKRRATTFRTSKGTAVSVTYPDIYIEPGFVLPEDVTSPTEMRESLAGTTGIVYAHKNYAVPLNSLFFSNLYDPATGVFKTGVLEDVWHIYPEVIFGSEYVRVPANRWFSAFTRNSWMYPWGGVKVRLPTFPIAGSLWLFGFEPGFGIEWGIAAFLMSGATLKAYVNGNAWSLANYLPATYNTAEHEYFIKMNRSNIEFYIDRSSSVTPVLICLRGWVAQMAPITGPPYDIVFCDAQIEMMDESPAFFEITGFSTDFDYLLRPDEFRAMAGDPLPPRSYRLYNTGTNTLLEGLVVNPDVTSHPVPTFGYSTKTLLFRADEAGTLSIQVLTRAGNWREYDSVAVAANTLLSYIMTGDAVLARIMFTPTAPPATITDAEVVLG